MVLSYYVTIRSDFYRQFAFLRKSRKDIYCSVIDVSLTEKISNSQSKQFSVHLANNTMWLAKVHEVRYRMQGLWQLGKANNSSVASVNTILDTYMPIFLIYQSLQILQQNASIMAFFQVIVVLSKKLKYHSRLIPEIFF